MVWRVGRLWRSVVTFHLCLGFGCQPLVVPLNSRRFSSKFHAGFNAQVFGDALDDNAQVPRRWVAVTVEHPMKGFFAQAGLPRQFFETDFGV